MTALAVLGLATLSGCINRSSVRGVPDVWNEVGADTFETGRTTRTEVLELLGPPSQIVTLEDGVAYYYLLEKSTTKGLILVLYNSHDERTTYERAVFFFDDDGVLVEYAIA